MQQLRAKHYGGTRGTFIRFVDSFSGIGTLSEPIQAPINDWRDSTSAQNPRNPTSYPCDGTGEGLSRLMFSGMISFNLYPLMAPEDVLR